MSSDITHEIVIDDCQRCGDRPATDRLQRTLGGVSVGHPVDVCCIGVLVYITSTIDWIISCEPIFYKTIRILRTVQFSIWMNKPITSLCTNRWILYHFRSIRTCFSDSIYGKLRASGENCARTSSGIVTASEAIEVKISISPLTNLPLS